LLGRALDEVAGQAEHNAGAVACTKLIALTGLRLSEAQALQWAEVDFDGCAIRLGDSKTGTSIRPLGQEAADLLRAIPRQGAYVFPSAKGKSGHTQSVPKFWRETLLPKASDIARRSNMENLDGLDRHALRHSLAGTAEGLGLTVPTIAALLGHSLAGVTEGYVLKRLDAALIASADRVSTRIQSMMSGQESASVLSLQRTAS
jgi:integrase